MRAFIYRLLRIANDINAISKKKVDTRVARRVVGKITQKLFNGWFR